MVVALFAFLAVTGVILGAYAAVAFLPGFLAGRQLEQRLRDVSMPEALAAGGESTIVKRDEEGPLPGLDKIMARTGAGSKLSLLIAQSGVKTSSSTIGMICLGMGVMLALITSLFIRQIFGPIAGLLLGLWLPIGFLMHRRSGRLKKFEEQFPEALDLLSRAIRAGHAFQTAMGMVADELPEPVGPEFKTTFDQQNFGLPLRDALNELAQRIDILDVRFFVTAVSIQRDTGGNLAEILDNLAHVVRERFKIRRQVRVHTAHGRFTGWVLMALPAALGVVLSFINPDHMQLLFREHMGQVMLVGAMVLQIIGYIWIRQVIKIEV